MKAKPIIAAFILISLLSVTSCEEKTGDRNTIIPDTTHTSGGGDGD